MKRESSGGAQILSAVFVDYDNIYMSLKRKSDEAAKRFAKDAQTWLKAIEQGTLITPTNGAPLSAKRRIVMNRCYGNPVPRRNPSDNSTDMSSFPFVRHHFLRAGFEVMDCPPLTAQLKNSSDIRMVMDIRDLLNHDTYFDEFIILSGDADFTPVLHRLRAHARNTVIFANDYTAAPYTAISDGEIREADFIAFLADGKLPAEASEAAGVAPVLQPLEAIKREIGSIVVESVRNASGPVPIEALADRAVRALGAEKTTQTGWAGAGSFRAFLTQVLAEDVRLSEAPPYVAYDAKRSPAAAIAEVRESILERSAQLAAQRVAAQQPQSRPLAAPPAAPAPVMPAKIATETPLIAAPPPPLIAQRPQTSIPKAPPVQAPPQVEPARQENAEAAVQQAIQRIHDACQAPPLMPNEYRQLFEIMAKEISDHGLSGAQTISNITQRALEAKLNIKRDDARFVLEVVSEADPWFEQGASANLFAGRFRNFVVARCRSQGLSLSADDLDLIDAWFAGGSMQSIAARQKVAAKPADANREDTRWWGADQPKVAAQGGGAAVAIDPGHDQAMASDDFPRIVRSRLR
ncbi:MAG: NYN domain-containing protein [Hyphomicrobiaceae bacterium]|nr:MAG: NYN domain-containing protein [Hyphomicrobiaceae bacterium]